jgi:hypothetical protein
MVKPKKILRLRNDAGGIVAMPSDSIGNNCFDRIQLLPVVYNVKKY